MSELKVSKAEIDFEEKIKFETRKKIEQEKEASCCCLFFTQIKNLWHRFYSGRTRIAIDLFFLAWEKWTFWYNIGDVLAMIIGGTIKFLVPSTIHDIALQFAEPLMEIFLCLKFILPVLIGVFYLIKLTCLLPSSKKVAQQIEKDDAKREISLQNIRENGFFSGSGIKFVWQNFKGRLFDFVVTSMFLAFMNLSGTWFVLYCIFVIWGAFGIIKDIIVARCRYHCLVDNKFESKCNELTKSLMECTRYKPGQYFASEFNESKTKPKTTNNGMEKK